jgi:hypothetical protein
MDTALPASFEYASSIDRVYLTNLHKAAAELRVSILEISVPTAGLECAVPYRTEACAVEDSGKGHAELVTETGELGL